MNSVLIALLLLTITIETNGYYDQFRSRELLLQDFSRTRCIEDTFKNNDFLSLDDVRFEHMGKGCISNVKKLIIKNSKIGTIETSAIYGRFDKIEIKNSTIEKIEKEGLNVNVSKFYFEKNLINKFSQDSLAVTAEKSIIIKNCTVNDLEENALRSLKVKRNSSQYRLHLNNVYIKNPQNGSLHITKNQRVKIDDLRLEIPCTCDIESTFGLDTELWMDQPLCLKGIYRPHMGYYLKKFCNLITTTQASIGTTIPSTIKAKSTTNSKTTADLKTTLPSVETTADPVETTSFKSAADLIPSIKTTLPFIETTSFKTTDDTTLAPNYLSSRSTGHNITLVVVIGCAVFLIVM